MKLPKRNWRFCFNGCLQTILGTLLHSSYHHPSKRSLPLSLFLFPCYQSLCWRKNCGILKYADPGHVSSWIWYFCSYSMKKNQAIENIIIMYQNGISTATVQRTKIVFPSVTAALHSDSSNWKISWRTWRRTQRPALLWPYHVPYVGWLIQFEQVY